MFGSIRPQRRYCSRIQRQEYKKFYCGLCMAMGKAYGKNARFFLNYDLTNDYMLFAIGDGDYEEKRTVCPWSLRRKTVPYYEKADLADYFAALNYLLVYHNFADDVLDNTKKQISKSILKKMQRHIGEVEKRLPDEAIKLQSYLDELHALEAENSQTSVFAVSDAFGRLLETAVNPPCDNAESAAVIKKMNYWTGVWIYTIDAISDCLSDDFKHNYNPITAGRKGDALKIMRSRKDELLDILQSCRNNLLCLADLMPPNGHAELIKNLFNTDLPLAVRICLEVPKNEFNAERKTETVTGEQ